MEHDVAKLEKQLKTLDERITELHRIGLVEKLQPVIHGPGWTTIAEFMLVSNAVESLTRQIENQIQASRQLLEGAKRVEKAGAKSAA